MPKCEVLSPAGNMEMLKYAVLYGADAVYLSGTKYGARKFAPNFDEKELKIAVEYAHLYGVKVYLTINTLIYTKEIEDFIEYVKYAYSIGIDAFLVQDFGMLNLIHKLLPDLELHASTQLHNNSSMILDLLKSIGVKRVVLDREMSLDEIKKLPSDIEKEVFCHGALCVSYSGQCLLSSFILKRSGNRGECAGLCRLPYTLIKEGKIDKTAYYLSLKDLCTTDYIKDLIESGVSSLKIEGRMKSPQYVGYMTKIYRRLVDDYYRGITPKVTDEEMKNIQILFNRKLTKGYLANTKDEDMVNTISPNHIGIHLGTYRVINKKIELKLDEDLHQGDTIRFQEAKEGMVVNFLYNTSDKFVNSICKHSLGYVDNFLNIQGTGELRLVGSSSLNKEIDTLPKRSVNIEGTIKINKDKPIELTVKCGDYSLVSTGVIPENAKNRPITKEDIIKQITKTGSYVYKFDNLKVDLEDNLFVNIKDLNELRREALDRLDKERTKMREFTSNNFIMSKINNTEREVSININVANEEQYHVVKKYTGNIFTDNSDLLKKYKNDIKPKYEDHIDKIAAHEYIISDYGSLSLIKKEDIVHTDYMLNAVNPYTINELINFGVDTVAISVEASMDDIKDLTPYVDSSHIELFTYGKIELMKMKYDPCPTEKHIALIDRNKEKYQIKKTRNFKYLLSSKCIDKSHEIEEYLKLGIRNFRIDFYNENERQCEEILSKIVEKCHKFFSSE